MPARSLGVRWNVARKAVSELEREVSRCCKGKHAKQRG